MLDINVVYTYDALLKGCVHSKYRYMYIYLPNDEDTILYLYILILDQS